MEVDRNRWHAVRSWLFVGLMAALAAVFGALQYRWIGEVSRAEHDRLLAGLQSSLYRLGQDFNAEVTVACSALLPTEPPVEGAAREQAYLARYVQWRESSNHHRLVRRAALAIPRGDELELLLLDPEKRSFAPGPWPAAWNAVQERLLARLANQGFRPFDPATVEESAVIDVPRFYPSQPGGPRRQPRSRPEAEWLIVELDIDYVRTAILPDLVQRHLGGNGKLEYHSEVVLRGHPSARIYSSDQSVLPGEHIDASAALFEVQYDQIRRRAGAGAGGQGPARALNPDRGRWQISARHRAGSLEAVVNQTRLRNLALATAILALMLAAMAALARFTQRAQRLAHLQMEFVTGVSHELRTPLSVIRTAAHNLSGGLVGTPQQMKRYGALIAGEADRLTAIVEQVLQFAGAKAGRAIRAREPVEVQALIEDSLKASAGFLDESHCVIEKRIEPGLPPVLADPVALHHALQNLLTNAAKYGAAGGWIGVSAARPESGTGAVEIRVTDRGRGIPAAELGQIFDPFYRGKDAIEDQIHGTGLGLNLVKRIVEAHDGTVSVRSEPGRGTEFVLRIPAAPVEQQDELADSISRG